MARSACTLVACALLIVAGSSCSSGDTGGALVRFHAYATGIPGVSGTLDFDASSGFHVTLTKAHLHIGAVYWRLGQTNPGSANASCVGATVYGLQVPGAVDVDVLSSTLQEFSVLGDATTDLDQSAEIWLTGGDINAASDPTVLVDVAGTATKAGAVFPFAATMTISENRTIPPSNPAEPGENPICKQRIIVPIPIQLTPSVGGDLSLTIDPRPWLDAIDFSDLPPSDDDPSTFIIPDVSNGTGVGVNEGRAFFQAVTQASATEYQFGWFVP